MINIALKIARIKITGVASLLLTLEQNMNYVHVLFRRVGVGYGPGRR